MITAFNLTVNKIKGLHAEAAKHIISWQQQLEICKLGMPGLAIFLLFF